MANGLVVPVLVRTLTEVRGNLIPLRVIQPPPTRLFRKRFQRRQVGLDPGVQGFVVAAPVLGAYGRPGLGDGAEFAEERLLFKQIFQQLALLDKDGIEIGLFDQGRHRLDGCARVLDVGQSGDRQGLFEVAAALDRILDIFVGRIER